MKRWIAVLSGVLAFAMAASGDVVHLKNGKKIEGDVVSRSGGKVVVKTKFGLNEFKESEVDRIEEKVDPKAEYKKRREAIGDKDTAALMDLYAWAKGEGLSRESTDALRDIIKADPEHEAARRLLGYVKQDGEWMTEKAAKKAEEAAERERMEAQGLVQYKGEWITAEEKDRREHEAKGEVLVDGRWVSKRDYEKAMKASEAKREAEEHKARGEYLVNGKWLPKAEANAAYANIETPYIVRGDKVVVMTNRGIDFGDRIIVTADAAYRKAHQFFGKEPETGPLNVFFANTMEEYNRLGADVLGADQKSSEFYAFCSGWLPDNPLEIDMASATFYYQADSLADVYVTHATVEQFVQRLIGRDASDLPPRWFIDGVASYVERWQPDQLFGWSKERLRGVGGNLKLKTLFGSYPVTEQSILEAGLLIAFLKDPSSPETLRSLFQEAVVAVNDGKKVSKAFRKLEKALTAEDDQFYDWADV